MSPSLAAPVNVLGQFGFSSISCAFPPIVAVFVFGFRVQPAFPPGLSVIMTVAMLVMLVLLSWPDDAVRDSVPVRSGREISQSLERPRKTALASEAGSQRDLRDRQPKVLEERLRTLDALLQNVLVRREPRALLEQSNEMIHAHLRDSCEVQE